MLISGSQWLIEMVNLLVSRKVLVRLTCAKKKKDKQLFFFLEFKADHYCYTGLFKSRMCLLKIANQCACFCSKGAVDVMFCERVNV